MIRPRGTLMGHGKSNPEVEVETCAAHETRNERCSHSLPEFLDFKLFWEDRFSGQNKRFCCSFVSGPSSQEVRSTFRPKTPFLLNLGY